MNRVKNMRFTGFLKGCFIKFGYQLFCHMMKNLLLLLLVFPCILQAQQVTLTSDQIKALTPDWKGERSPDGRPKVPDRLLERLKKISVEEAWGILRSRGFQNQYEGDWQIEH